MANDIPDPLEDSAPSERWKDSGYLLAQSLILREKARIEKEREEEKLAPLREAQRQRELEEEQTRLAEFERQKAELARLNIDAHHRGHTGAPRGEMFRNPLRTDDPQEVTPFAHPITHR